MSFLVRSVATVLVLLLSLTEVARPAPAPESAPSEYVQQLQRLLDVYDALNAAVSRRMKANERHVLAKHLMSLSDGFYTLMNAKADLITAIENSPSDSIVRSPRYSSSAGELDHAVRCLQAHLRDKGSRFAAITDLDGYKIELVLRGLTYQKSVTLQGIAAKQGLPDIENPIRLREAVLNDAREAKLLAEQLYRLSAQYAVLFDRSVIGRAPTKCAYPRS